MVVARNTLAIALCVLPALAIAGLSEEPPLDTDGESVTCGTPAGNSVLQRRATQLHGHASNATEGGDQAAIETAPPFCGAGTWWGWKPGDGEGGRNIKIGESISMEGCEEACAKEAWKGTGFNGCTYSHRKMECWAEENMRGAKALDGWITSFVPSSCVKVTITGVTEGSLAFDHESLCPCHLDDWYQIALYHGAGGVAARGPIRVWRRYFGRADRWADLITCLGAGDTSICDSAKVGDHFFWPASVNRRGLCR